MPNKTWTVGRRVGVLGAVLLVAGVLAGFVPFSAGDYQCGSAWRPSDSLTGAQQFIQQSAAAHGVPDPTSGDCAGPRTVWRASATALLVGGVVLVGGAWMTGTRRRVTSA